MIQTEQTKHEQKICQRCSEIFECKVGDITQCQCFGIEFTDAEKEYVDARFNDCLCRSCLKDVKREFKFKPIKDKMQLILSYFKTQ